MARYDIMDYYYYLAILNSVNNNTILLILTGSYVKIGDESFDLALVQWYDFRYKNDA